jgi:hypothetical protein
MRTALPFALTAGLSVLAATASFAAVIEPVAGTSVSINRQGQGFQTVTETSLAKPGDLVMVSLYGSANIFFPDGCKIVLQPGSVMAITALSPCASRANAQATPDNLPFPPDVPPLGPEGALAFTGAALGVTGFAAYEIFHAHKSNPAPASP